MNDKYGMITHEYNWPRRAALRGVSVGVALEAPEDTAVMFESADREGRTIYDNMIGGLEEVYMHVNEHGIVENDMPDFVPDDEAWKSLDRDNEREARRNGE